MIVDFKRCVRAIAEVLAEEGGNLDPERREEVVQYVLATCSLLPDHIRIGLRSATILFDGAAFFKNGRAFHRLDTKRRRRIFERWEEARLGPMRSFASFYRSLTTFAAEYARTDQQTSPRERLVEQPQCSAA